MTALNVLTAELETARKIFWLLMEDQIFLTSYNSTKETWDDGAYPAINCNDIFVPGADAENLAAEDLDLYIEAVKKWPKTAGYAWCAVKRASKPWRKVDSAKWVDDYNAAIDGITELLVQRDKRIKNGN